MPWMFHVIATVWSRSINCCTCTYSVVEYVHPLGWRREPPCLSFLNDLHRLTLHSPPTTAFHFHGFRLPYFSILSLGTRLRKHLPHLPTKRLKLSEQVGRTAPMDPTMSESTTVTEAKVVRTEVRLRVVHYHYSC